MARPWASDVLHELGAEVVDDVDRAPWSDVDLVFDLVGGEMLRRACTRLKPGGRVVSVVEPPLVEAGKCGWFFVVEPSRAQLAELGQRIVAGELRPVIGAAWPLAERRAAFEAKQRGRQAGKAALLVYRDAAPPTPQGAP